MDIITTNNINAILLEGDIAIVFIPAQHLRQCTWALLNLVLYGGCSQPDAEDSLCATKDEQHICRSKQTEIFSMVVETEGMTVFMDPEGVEIFKDMQEYITVAPQHWRAIQIHLGPMGSEFPGGGVVSYLSKLLAGDNISILNASTYDTDIIYVQKKYLHEAVTCLQSKLARGVHGLREAREAQHQNISFLYSTMKIESQQSTDENDVDEEVKEELSPPSTPVAISAAEQYLVVYPGTLVLVRVPHNALRECAYGLTQLILLSSGRDKFFWCYCETQEEISLFMNQSCLKYFPSETIIVAPDCWKAIKLGGRTYGFDETGVVAAMSGFETETQILNVSSFGNNLSFVLEHTLEESLETLCTSLNISKIVR